MRVFLLTAMFSILASCSTTTREQAFHAIEAGDLQRVKELISKGDLDKSMRDQAGRTPLAVAIESGQDEVVLYLLQKNFDPNEKSKEAGLLGIAASGHPCNPRIVRWLVKFGADINEQDSQSGQPVIHAAISTGNVACAKELIALGANTSAKNKLGYGILSLTAVYHDSKGLKDLIESYPTFDPNSEDAKKALAIAIGARDASSIKLLDDFGVKNNTGGSN